MKQILLSNGTTIAYKDSGKGTNIVVLLHGFCGSSAYWNQIIPKLEGTYRVIAPDLRGHGQSSVPEGNYTMQQMAEDISLLLRKLDVTNVMLFGHSLGGYITLAFAEKYGELLRGYALVHSTAFPDDEKGKENRLKAIQTIEEKGIRSFIDALIPRLFAPEHIESMAGEVASTVQLGYGTTPEGAIRTLHGMRERPDCNDVLAASSLPVLLIAGEQDQIIPMEKTFSITKPNIKQVKFSDAGHMSMLEIPEKLSEVISQFLHS